MNEISHLDMVYIGSFLAPSWVAVGLAARSKGSRAEAFWAKASLRVGYGIGNL